MVLVVMSVNAGISDRLLIVRSLVSALHWSDAKDHRLLTEAAMTDTGVMVLASVVTLPSAIEAVLHQGIWSKPKS